MFFMMPLSWLSTSSAVQTRRSVVPDVLHVVVVLHEVDHLGHVLDVLFRRQLDVVLGHHLTLVVGMLATSM